MKSTIFPGFDGLTFGRNFACGSKLHHFPADTKAGSSVRWYTELKPIPKRPGNVRGLLQIRNRAEPNRAEPNRTEPNQEQCVVCCERDLSDFVHIVS